MLLDNWEQKSNPADGRSERGVLIFDGFVGLFLFFLLDALPLVLLLHLVVFLSILSAILFIDLLFFLHFSCNVLAAVIGCVIAMKMLLLKSCLPLEGQCHTAVNLNSGRGKRLEEYVWLEYRRSYVDSCLMLRLPRATDKTPQLPACCGLQLASSSADSSLTSFVPLSLGSVFPGLG